MKVAKIRKRSFVFILILCILVQMIPMNVYAVAPDADQIQSSPFPVNYDPNDGMIQYGHSGEVGFRPENDINNTYERYDKVIYFPDDLINEVDENGNLLFPDYNPTNKYYDYSDMLNQAMKKSRTMDNADIFVKEGVYYFTKSVYLNDGTNLNATAGKTAFVIKPNYQDKDGNPVEVTGFFTNPNLNETYLWYQGRISDIVFVVEGTHESFKPTSSVDTILNNLCSDDVNAVKNFELFYRVRMKYASIDNIAASGFYSFMRWTFVDMLTRVTSVTVGPTRYVYYGVQTNDAFFYDGYYYGGYFTEENLHELPIFQMNFSMGTTVFSNSYIGNYFFSRSGAGCWCPHTTYSNLTLERVCNFVMDTTTVSSSVSGCLFKNCAYNDIKKYFESQGLTPYDHDTRYYDHSAKKWVYPGTGYLIRDNVVGDNAYDRKHSANHWDGQMLTMIQLHSGIAFTQNKIQCDSLDWTTLVRLTDSGWTSAYDGHRNATNLQFSDNAFEIREWDYENLMIDDWEGGKPYTEGWHDNTIIVWGEKGYKKEDGTPAMGWVGAEGPEPVCWLKDGVYISVDLERYIDLSAFLDKDKPSAGYAALGAVGADEQGLWDAGLEDRYYNDVKTGNYEVVSFTDDFGGMGWNYGSNYQKLQTAFDYVATHDAILYIESGTYYTDKPIVLRGGKTYRVVFNGTIRSQKTTNMDGAGIFSMSGDDNAPIKGYFINPDLYMQDCNTSGFFNVNTEDFYIKVRSMARGVGAFTNCKLKNTVIHEGQIQYNDYGFFYKTVTDNVLVKNVYGTASTGVEGEDGYTPGDINYKYFISSSDFTNSTWRGCWLEFGQFSNGKTLTGAGNSVYRGNIIDYTYNYSFGKNDVVCGNTMTRASYGSIVNHMENSNFPIDKPDALTDKPMIMYHINDGLRLVGNTNLGAMNLQTHFIELDSPGIRYTDEDGNTVVSISNVRVAGNVVYTETEGEYKQNIPVMPFDRAENVVFENCKNNEILLQSWYVKDQFDDPDTEEVETPYTITKEEVISWSVPGTKIYVNGEYVEVKEATAPAKNLVQIETPQPPQDKIYDIPNVWLSGEKQTEYLLYDFKERTPEEAQALAEKMAGYIDNSTIVNYRGSQYNKAVIDGVEKGFAYGEIKDLPQEERYAIFAQTIKYGLDKSVSGQDAFLMDGSREITDGEAGCNGANNNLNRPTYAIVFRDENISGDSLTGVNTSFYYDFKLSRAWQGKRPIFIILSEDDTRYYGIVLGYGSNNDGIITATCSFEKDYFSHLVDGRPTQGNNFPQEHFENGISYNSGNVTQLSHIDLFSGITRPIKGEQSKTVLGDYTEIPMFEGNVYNYDSVVLGVDLTCEYSDEYGTVSVYATFDFSNIGEDASQTPTMKASARKVWIGTFDIQGDNKIFGIWTGDKTWLESVQFEYKPENASTCMHTYTEEITRAATCTREGVVRQTCNTCGYEYEKKQNAPGHSFFDKRQADGSTLRTCSVCGVSFVTKEPVKYSCDHEYEYNVVQRETCTTDGAVCRTCTICEEMYMENVPAPGHKYVETVVQPTTSERGYTIHACSVCDEFYIDDYVDSIKGNTLDESKNVISGIAQGDVFEAGQVIRFAAVGDCMDITPAEYAHRYVPESWQSNVSGSWSGAPYTASFFVQEEGSYTLSVTFRDQVYLDGRWSNTENTHTVTVDFNVVNKDSSPGASNGEPEESDKSESSDSTNDKPSDSTADKPSAPIVDKSSESTVTESSEAPMKEISESDKEELSEPDKEEPSESDKEEPSEPDGEDALEKEEKTSDSKPEEESDEDKTPQEDADDSATDKKGILPVALGGSCVGLSTLLAVLVAIKLYRELNKQKKNKK